MILALVLVIGAFAFMTYMLSRSDNTLDPQITQPSQTNGQQYNEPEYKYCDGEHTYGEWSQTKAPTCTEKGTQKRICSVCKAGEESDIAALGHSYTSAVTAPTSNAQGYTLNTCRTCNDSYRSDFTAPTGSVGLEYALNSDGASYKVKGMGSCTDTYVAVASTYNGKPVTAIGDEAFRMCKTITGIYLPDCIKRLGDSAFAGCTGLKTVTLPRGLTSVGTYTFYSCSGLETVVFPVEIKGIGNFAFYGCRTLSSILYDGTAEDWAKVNVNANGNDCVTGNNPEQSKATVYFYSEQQTSGTWKYVDGEPVVTK